MVSSVDVAKLAGVSQATVSRVLNSPEKVNMATVDKVNAAIKQLNYRPNAAARSLISSKSGIIAIVCGPLDDPENAEFSSKSISYAQQNGYIAEIHIQDPKMPGKVFEAISKTQAEGLIAGPLLMKEKEMTLLEAAGIPYVLCGMDVYKKANHITMENYEAGVMAAEYISSFQHRVVGWLGGDERDSRLDNRYKGFSAIMKKEGVEVLTAIGHITDYDFVFSAMMARKNRPTAIVAATDQIGAYAIDFLLDFGYSVPEDIAVMGIGNSMQSSRNYLKLTSVGIPGQLDIYTEAMERLFSMIKGQEDEGLLAVKIAPELFERKSTIKT